MARAALITGGSRGIGQSLARALLAAGHDVAITAARDGAALDAARGALAAEFGETRVLAILADASDPADADRAVEAVLARFGRIDILVNNAGRGPREVSQDFHHTAHPFWETDPWGLGRNHPQQRERTLPDGAGRRTPAAHPSGR